MKLVDKIEELLPEIEKIDPGFSSIYLALDDYENNFNDEQKIKFLDAIKKMIIVHSKINKSTKNQIKLLHLKTFLVNDKEIVDFLLKRLSQDYNETSSEKDLICIDKVNLFLFKRKQNIDISDVFLCENIIELFQNERLKRLNILNNYIYQYRKGIPFIIPESNSVQNREVIEQLKKEFVLK